MTQDVYERLARHLDSLPAGFPRTESGVELRILKKLFTEDQADLARYLIMMLEPAQSIAKRANRDVKETADKLYDMSRKGLVLRADKPGNPMYMAAQYVIGIWEFHVNDMDTELIKDMNEYIPALFGSMQKLKT